MQVELNGEFWVATARRTFPLKLVFRFLSATTIADKLKVDFGLINRSRDLEADGGPSRRDSMKLLVGDVKDKVGMALQAVIDESLQEI